MAEDRRRPEQYPSLRDEALGPWLRTAVVPYSPVVRAAFERNGIEERSVRGVRDLRGLPVLDVASLGDGTEHVLEPTVDSVEAHAAPWLRAKLAVATVAGTRDDLVRDQFDRPFKPVNWHVVGDLRIASSAADLDRLRSLGRRSLGIAGVTEADRIAVVGPVGADPASLQVVLGAWDAGVAVAPVPEHAAAVATAEATVLAGPAAAVESLVAAGVGVRSVIAWTDAADPTAALSSLLATSPVPVSPWWSPPGVRAAWPGCVGGTGFHTWPVQEHLEILDGRTAVSEGRVVWSPVGWYGSVWFRLAVAPHGRLDTGACPTCGRTTPRVVALPAEEAIASTATSSDRVSEASAVAAPPVADDPAPAEPATGSEVEPAEFDGRADDGDVAADGEDAHERADAPADDPTEVRPDDDLSDEDLADDDLSDEDLADDTPADDTSADDTPDDETPADDTPDDETLDSADEDTGGADEDAEVDEVDEVGTRQFESVDEGDVPAPADDPGPDELDSIDDEDDIIPGAYDILLVDRGDELGVLVSVEAGADAADVVAEIRERIDAGVKVLSRARMHRIRLAVGDVDIAPAAEVAVAMQRTPPAR